jgi:two-component system cell cycle sensor histidine kinase/response regulator CckA
MGCPVGAVSKNCARAELPKLAEQVTALKPGVRVLHMSGYTAGLLDPQGISGGRLAFVQKPFTAQALLEKVRAMLSTPPEE